jgi:hypothetical protein
VGVTAITRFEMAFMTWMAITAGDVFTVAAGAEYFHFHDFKYSTIGVAANVATQFMTAAGALTNSVFERFYLLTDAGQGPMFELAAGAPYGLTFRDFQHMHTVGVLATSLLDVVAVGAINITVGPGVGSTAGAAGAVTQLVNVPAAMTAVNGIILYNFIGSVGYATNATIFPAAGTAADIGIAHSQICTVGGGAGGAAYIGTA